MGAVYEAIDPSGGRVAVKVLLMPAEMAKGQTFLERFEREATITSSIDSPHVVKILDTGVDPGTGFPYIVMPLMVGTDLRQLGVRQGPLQPAVAVRLVRQVCFALAQAHEKAIIHRDIKPANIFLEHTSSGEVVAKVLDFGIAKLSTEETHLTRTGSLLGTPRYMSPEQMRNAKSIDARADIWSLGATLYKALCGTSPFESTKGIGEIFVAISTQTMPNLQDFAPWIEPELAQIVHGTLIRDRDQRCPSVAELAEALEPFSGGTDAVQVNMLEPVPKEMRARRAARLPEIPTVWNPPRRGAHASSSASRITSSTTDPLLGCALSDRYTLLRRLGTGGMGSIYESLGPDGRRYAVKVIDLRHSSDPAARRRLVMEAQSLTRVQSENVVRLYAAETDETLNTPFLVMEMLHGIDLGVMLDLYGALQPTSVARVFAQASKGLAAAHAKGIIHRDIKPANLFLHELPSGEVVVQLCDFGIAKHLTGDDIGRTSVNLTQTGGVVGSPMYMSPEQSRSAKHIDHRTDIWSLGASMYEALTGAPLWKGRETVGEIIVALCTEQIPPLKDRAPWVPDGLANVVDRALCRNPDDRFQSAEELHRALLPFTKGRLALHVEELSTGSVRSRSASAALSTNTGMVHSVRPTSKTRIPLLTFAAALAVAGAGSGLLFAHSSLSLQRSPARDVSLTTEQTATPAVITTQPEATKQLDINVAILPATAFVTVDGEKRTLTDGKLRLSGEVGDAFKVVVTHEEKVLEKSVFILKDGTPSIDRIELPRPTTVSSPAASQSTPSRPSTSRPSTSRPSTSRPSTSRPSTSRPSTQGTSLATPAPPATPTAGPVKAHDDWR
jgi:serine/threonine protein kinase